MAARKKVKKRTHRPARRSATSFLDTSAFGMGVNPYLATGIGVVLALLFWGGLFGYIGLAWIVCGLYMMNKSR